MMSSFFDRYATPADALKPSEGIPLRQRSSPAVQVRERAASGIYSEVSDVRKTTPTSQQGQRKGEVGVASEDAPYEEVEYNDEVIEVFALRDAMLLMLLLCCCCCCCLDWCW